MLEEHVAFYLQKYLGNYVKGLSREALKISAWQGNVELTNMQLKPEALNALKLPVKVKAGFLGSVKLKVPWSKLGKEPVIVLLDRIFVVAEPQTNVEAKNDASVQEEKSRKIQEMESAILDAKFGGGEKPEVNNSWLGSLISTIIGNLKLSITNIHIRYEDSESHPGHPFAIGLTLKKLAAVTVDENGKETFISSGPLDRIQKAGELEGLALYLDPDTKPWEPAKPWENLSQEDWSKMFEPNIEAKAGEHGSSTGAPMRKCHYLLQPVGATARYAKSGSGDTRTADKELQKAVLRFYDVTLSCSQAQYRDALKLGENFSTLNKRMQYSQYRPSCIVKENPKAWWKYAYNVIAEQLRKASGRMTWDQIVRFTRLRKKYLSSYINCLQSNPNSPVCNDNKEIQKLERDLDIDVAVQWRMLAHSYVDKNRKDETSRKQQPKGGWLSFLWGNQSSDGSNESRSFSEEDWKQLNEVIGYQETSDSSILPGQDPPDMLHTVLEIHMQHNATKLVDDGGGNIIELSAEDLQCNAKLYGEMKLFDFKLGSYKLTSPEGLLAESESQIKAIGGEFILKPIDRNVDWSLSAQASPCYITYLKGSIDEVLNFFSNSDAVSQTVALETAAALQATFGEVARSAQQQLNEALKQRPQFSLYLDIAAPKIIVPSEFYPDGKHQSKLLLDLGHLTLQTEEPSRGESQEEHDLYMHFRLGLTDVQIFLLDGEFDWRDHYNVSSGSPGKLKFEDTRPHFSVLERCGIAVALQQICVPHPAYPTTRVAVRLPSLGFRFSPARYHRLMQVFKVFQSDSTTEDEKAFRPWDPADFEGDVSVLVWKGVGNREAVWQRSHAALAGPFLYILDSPLATSAKRRVSFNGKQVVAVPPESIGGVTNVLAVCDGGQFNNKVAESVNTLLLRFDNEETRDAWLGRLQAAVYRSSAPAAVSGILASSDKEEEVDSESNEKIIANVAEKENVFLTGALDELKIVINSGPTGRKKSREQILLAEESPLVELRALGSKVEFVMRQYDMSIGAVLQALEIEDKYSGNGSSDIRYLACSDLDMSKRFQNGAIRDTLHDTRVGKPGRRKGRVQKGSKEQFFDTEEDLGKTEAGEGHTFQNRHYSRSSSDFYDAEDHDLTDHSSIKDPPEFNRIPGLLPDPKDPLGEDSHEDNIQDKFVKAQVLLISLDSPYYNNVDKQITVSLATLSFFCIRPTIMAMLNFTDAITAEVEPDRQHDSSSDGDKGSSSTSQSDESAAKPAFDRKDSVIKGLLGSGKERTMFSLLLIMRRAVITLNTETGGHLASLAQEDLRCNIKVFPSSFSISASLGNLRISDGSVEPDHPYHYICDTRNPGSTSFIELEFSSFGKDDNDYEGYEYSLKGKLSEIRFVYLNRFIQEISGYFMGLAPQSPGYVVKIDNKVTDVEKFFTQSEVEGSPAIKLNISLTKPILTMPRETHSRDFLELDVLHIEVVNSINWIGGGHDNPGAVRLDTTVLHVEDIHLSIGLNGESGEGIIKKANGLSLSVTRSLRDLWHQVPGVDASIKIEELKADLSDKEYQVITECALTNLAERANIPPPVCLTDSESDSDEEQTEQIEEVTKAENKGKEDRTSDQNSRDGSWISILVTADIALVELSLFKGTARDQALATAQVIGVWVAYKVNSIQESYVMATLKSLVVKDDREGTEPALQHMIGKAEENDYRIENSSSSNSDSFDSKDGFSPLTMLVMDAKLSPTIQMVSLRIQQPKVLVAVDFLLAIAEFFVPSLHSTTSGSEDIDQDPLNFRDGLYLDQQVFCQERNEVVLTPKKPLVADNPSIEEYVYNGKDNILRLEIEEECGEPLIFIGGGKRLRFKNVVIQNADLLDTCVFLGVNSSYSVSESDRVFLKSTPEKKSINSPASNKKGRSKDLSKSSDEAEKEMVFDLQAIGPELTFYDSMSGHAIPQVTEKLVRAKMDVFSRFVLKGGDMELNAKINGLCVEASSGLNVVEPVNAEVKYSSVSGKQDIHITLSDILANFSFSVLQLVLRLQEDISSFLRITTQQATVECYQFDKIWVDESSLTEQKVTFWRARPPPGFAVLGDCVTPSDEPLAKGVLALNLSLAWFKRPIKFERVWVSGEYDSRDGCSIWMPIPPTNYVAFGCIVVQGMDPPPLSSVFCIKERVVTSSSLKDCILLESPVEGGKPRGAFWRVDNSLGSFFVESGNNNSVMHKPFELLQVTCSLGFPKVKSSDPSAIREAPTSEDVLGEQSTAGNVEQSQPTPGLAASGELCEPVAGFKLVWWNKGDNANDKISIWRPILPPGCCFVGDLSVEGYEPPSVGLVCRNQHEGLLLKKPSDFVLAGHIKKQRGSNELFFWFPLAPPGYTALGCIATESEKIDPDIVASFECIRNDLVVQSQYVGKLWSNERSKRMDEILSLWLVENELGTFNVQKGLKPPPKRLAFHLAELQKDNEPDNLVVDAELRTLSAVIYDDFRGLMIPLLNVSFSGVNASSHGRTDSLCSTLNFSLTAMTYNGKCYAWEPLVEPFDGVVRHNYKKSSSQLASGTTSQLRIVSTNIFNASISVNNLNMMLEAYASWNTLSNLMESSKADTMSGKAIKKEGKQPALDFRRKKSFQVTHHNKLGEDLLIRCVDINGQLKIVPLPSGGTASIELPTSSSILDPSLKVNINRSSVRIVAILLGSAKIRSSDTFGDQQYMATVRIFPQLQTADSFQLDQQSGRTRCITPKESADSCFQVVEWNEVFLCEMGSEDSCTVEIMVTELATGSAVGYCSFPLASSASDSNTDIQKKGDARPVCLFKMKWEGLKPPQESKDKGESSKNGEVCYSIYCFPTLKDEEKERSEGSVAKDLRPGTIQVSYKNRECWREIGLNYAASATCWRLGDDTIATETSLDDVNKEITFRSLVVIKNETEFLLDVGLSEKLTNKAHASSSGTHSTGPDSFGSSLIDNNNHSEVTDNTDNEKGGDFKQDEIRENERYQSLRSRKSAGIHGTGPFLLGTLHPQESIPVAITTLRPESPDYVLRIRPQEEMGSNGQSHHLLEWSNLVCCKGHTEPKSKQKSSPEVSLHSLIEAEQLIQCCKGAGSSNEHLKSIWFVFDIKARDRGTSPQLDPLKDWQIEIVAPLVLHNFLPVSSEFTVLEKCSGDNLILREKGVIEPGQKAHLYGVDIRQALYLTWIPQGGWQPEDVPVLISHPFKQLAKHITLKHFRTQRYLNVLVDHSSNGKDTIARRIRFYVPCWLDVKKIPPVYCNFAELKDKNKLHVHLDSKATANIKILELVQPEETDGQFTMLSNFNIEKMGISVALADTDKPCFPAPSSLAPLNQADGSVELRALDETGSRCYKILASTKLCPYQGIPTKILLLRPYITYTNRLGEPLLLIQTSSDEPKTLAPSDWRVNFPLPVTDEPERVQVRLGDTHWCVPFPIKQEGTFYISLRKNSSRCHVRMEIRGYEEGSRYLVVFRRGLGYGPYRLENRIWDTELQYRQKGSSDEDWQLLQPCSARLYAWENLEGEQLLEVLVAQDGVSDCETYDINNPGKYYHQKTSGFKDYFCEILEVGSVKVVKFCEFSKHSQKKDPSTSGTAESSQLLTVDVNGSSSSSRMEVQLELGQLGISLIDLKLQELLYLYMEKVSFVYATGYAGNLRRLKFFVGYLQLDNQLPFSALPVVFVPEEKNKNADPVMKISVAMCDQTPDAVQVYPYIGVKVTKSAWRVNIHEPIIWALLDFYNELHLDKASGDSDVGQVDPEMRFDLIDVSEIRFKLTVETAPRQRPRGILGIWGPFVTALGNTSKMPIHLRSVVHTNRYLRKSAIVTAIVNRLKKELIHNPLMLLSGVDVLGMTSSTLATLSETFAELSSDGKFLQLRLKLDRSRRIGGVGDGLVQGTEAFAQGIAYGVSGVIRKPVEKAREKGVIGFIQGLGKAALGVVMEPMSGVIDFVSFTVHGVGASCTKCFELFEQRPTFERVRLPRFIPPSGVLCCYNEKSAEGQYMLQFAEGKGRFRQGVLFREPSKFAWSDIYVDHFDVMNNKVVMLTNERVMLLQRPRSHAGARLPTEPCYILWDVPWQQLLSLELANTGSDQSPTYVVLHLCNQCTPFADLIKFSSRNSDEELLQARTLLRGISKAWKSNGPSRKQTLRQMGVKRQYRTSLVPPTSVSPTQAGGSSSEAGENKVDASSVQGSTTEIQRQKEVFNFAEIWASEQVAGLSLCVDMMQSNDDVVTIWRPIVPEGYVSAGDIAHIGKHPPLVSVAYPYNAVHFKHPIGFDLVWRSWKEGFVDPITLWMPRAPEGYYPLGCVAMAGHIEPDVNDVWCAHSSIVEDASFEEQEIWHSPNNSAWACYVYQVASDALTFMAVRQTQQRSHIRPRKVVFR